MQRRHPLNSVPKTPHPRSPIPPIQPRGERPVAVGRSAVHASGRGDLPERMSRQDTYFENRRPGHSPHSPYRESVREGTLSSRTRISNAKCAMRIPTHLLRPIPTINVEA